MAYQDKLPILKNFVETTTASYASAVDSIIYVADASIFPPIMSLVFSAVNMNIEKLCMSSKLTR